MISHQREVRRAGIRIWLTAHNRNLGGHTPLEFILDGFGDLVVAEAERVAFGGAS